MNLEKQTIKQEKDPEEETSQIVVPENIGSGPRTKQQQYQMEKLREPILTTSGIEVEEIEEIETSGGVEPETPASLEKDKERTEKLRKEIEESEILREEMEKIPPQEQEKIKFGLMNMGFFIEEWKDNFFAKNTKKAIGLVNNKKGTMARFLLALSENFAEDAKKARGNIEKVKKGDKKQIANLGYFASNILKYGRVITDIAGPTVASPLRYVMMGGMFFARGSEAVKEARLKNEELIEKTRINDITEASDEAWKIYKEAIGDKESISKEELDKAYQKNIPKDLMERLRENGDTRVGSGIIQSIVKKDVESSVKKIDQKIEKIENDGNLSDKEKQLKIQKIFNRYSKHLDGLDRMVSRYGTVDTIAMGAKYIETGAKAVVVGMTIDTLAISGLKIWEHLSEMLSTTSNETLVGKISEFAENINTTYLGNNNIVEHATGGLAGSGVSINEAQVPGSEHISDAVQNHTVIAGHNATENLTKGQPILPHEKVENIITKHSVVEKGGNIWDSAKSIVKDPHQFSEAWKNSMVSIPGHEGLVHISEVNLVHPGTTVEYMPGGNGVAGHFEVIAPGGQTIPNMSHQTAFTEAIHRGLSKISPEVMDKADAVMQEKIQDIYKYHFMFFNGNQIGEWNGNPADGVVGIKDMPVENILSGNFGEPFGGSMDAAQENNREQLLNFLDGLKTKPISGETTGEYIKRALAVQISATEHSSKIADANVLDKIDTGNGVENSFFGKSIKIDNIEVKSDIVNGIVENKVIVSGDVRGYSGTEVLSKDYLHHFTKGLSNSVLDKENIKNISRNLSLKLAAYSQLKSEGMVEKASILLENIHEEVLSYDKEFGGGIINHSKIPEMK